LLNILSISFGQRCFGMPYYSGWKEECRVFKNMIIPVLVSAWCLQPVGAGEWETAEARIKSVQAAAIATSPFLQLQLHEAALRGHEARSEAAATNLYVEWQSEGLGPERTPNAQDSLRVGTEFNFFGQMGPARNLAQTSEQGVAVIRDAAVRTTAFEATRRWLDLAAAVERLEVRRTRLEKLDTALALLEARHQLGEVAGTEVAQLDLEHTDAASLVAVAEAEVEKLRQSIAELCGDSFPDPRPGDLEALAAVSRSPGAGEVHDRALATGVPMQIASSEAEIEAARARMASAVAWGRPVFEVEWEHFPEIGPVEGFDAWGFRIGVPLPLGTAGARQRAAAREREAAAAASRNVAVRESMRRAEAAMAIADGAERRLTSTASALKTLPRIEESLSAQFRLGVLSYLEYVYGTVRHDELLLTVIDAHADLLSARLHLSYLLDDPSVFPTAVSGTGEDS
jgi:outer membrane protein TolC